MTAALLAHQGGWDEILMVLVPIVIFGVLLVVANRRANAMSGGGEGGAGGDRGSGDAGDRHGGERRARGRPPGGGTPPRGGGTAPR